MFEWDSPSSLSSPDYTSRGVRLCRMQSATDDTRVHSHSGRYQVVDFPLEVAGADLKMYTSQIMSVVETRLSERAGENSRDG